MAGIPEHVPTEITRAQVSALVAFGIRQENIATMLKISDETLRKYYRTELDIGLDEAVNKVASVLFNKAVEERDLAACTFFLKTRGKWREKDPEEKSKYDSLVEKLIDKLGAV